MSNTFGTIFRMTTFGESHGVAVGVVIDGCPPGVVLDEAFIQGELNRRRPGQSQYTTQRNEPDTYEVISGTYQGKTTGTPLTIMVRNKNQRSRDYDAVAKILRPGHADLGYHARFGIRDPRGGGRASARETVGRVIAGAIAQQILASQFGVQIHSWVSQIGGLKSLHYPDNRDEVETSPIRCPDPNLGPAMMQLIDEVKKDGDTIGGVVTCVAKGVPAGWGAPVFGKLEADLARAMLSIPACKGFEIGSGFDGVAMRGSEHNDPLVADSEDKQTSNHAGGTLGGLSSGAPIEFRCAFKPVSTHFKPQSTIDVDGNPTEFTNEGRHDPCVVPRAVPIVTNMTAMVLLDHALLTTTLLRV